MAEQYTGFKTITVPKNVIDEVFATGKTIIPDKRYNLYPNMFIILKCGESQSAITRVVNNELVLVKRERKAHGISPRNLEQICALDLLLDDNVKIVVLTGLAGTGKTLLAMAAAMHKMKKEVYGKLILTRPMSQVGKRELGILPGDLQEKFGPYLQNYINNLEQLTGESNLLEMDSYQKIDLIPLQLIRGASWFDSFIIADEVQVLSFHEMVTLGTRVGEKSKIVIMGDLKQRDENIAIEKTGMMKFINDQKSKESPLVGVVDLVKCERSAVASLFANVFEV